MTRTNRSSTRSTGGGDRPTRPRPRATAPRSSSARFPWTIALGGGLLLVVGALAIVTTSGSLSSPTQTAGPSSAPAASVGADRLPAFTATAADPAVGLGMPQVRGTAFDGTDVAIEVDGRAKVVLFVAHWCPHCQREVPVVQAWLDQGGLDPSVDLISVATSIDPARPNYPPDAWLERERWSPPVLVDGGGTVADRFGLSAFPYWVAVDREGKVVARATGELSPEQLEALVASAAR
jgi:thiol-disulfide isomerase/thioredoxin